MVKQPCFQVLGTLKGAFDAVFYRLRWQSFWSSNSVQVFVFSITALNVGGYFAYLFVQSNCAGMRNEKNCQITSG